MRAIIMLITIAVIAAGCSGTSNTKKMDPTYLNTITLNQMEFVNSTGQPWDSDGSGPDLRVALYLPGDEVEEHMSTIYYNVKQVDLPLEWNVSAKRLQMSGNTWTLKLFDEDDDSKRQLMHSWTFTPDIKQEMILLEGDNNKVYKVALNFNR